jgi:hypothetical protein
VGFFLEVVGCQSLLFFTGSSFHCPFPTSSIFLPSCSFEFSPVIEILIADQISGDGMVAGCYQICGG